MLLKWLVLAFLILTSFSHVHSQ